MAKSSFLVDINPLILGLAFGMAGDIVNEEFGGKGGAPEDISTGGFGIGVQYERQLHKNFSLTGRFDYLGISLGLTQTVEKSFSAPGTSNPDIPFDIPGRDTDISYNTDISAPAQIKMKVSTTSFEVQGRFYPFAKSFFIGGTAGYGNIKIAFDGQMVFDVPALFINGSQIDINYLIESGGFIIDTLTGLPIHPESREPLIDPSTGEPAASGASIDTVSAQQKVGLAFKPSRNYIKFGPSFGWRKSFGKRGGLTWETQVGYHFGIAMGTPFPKQVTKNVNEQLSGKKGLEIDEVEMDSDMEDFFKYAEEFVFMGGPRFSMAFGWRF